MPYIFYLPSYAATAWYHKVLKDRPGQSEAVHRRSAPSSRKPNTLAR